MKQPTETTSNAPLLQARGLAKHFALNRTLMDVVARRPVRTLRAVDHVDLEINRGETLGIVGESGCGKSTLARCLMRLYEPDAGSILFSGNDITKVSGAASVAHSRRVQMVFQDPNGSLNPRMTVGDTLAEALSVHRVVARSEIAARVRSLLDLVHLPADAGTCYPHEFSGGQRQRIGIARALAVEPSLIIADEPVSALDVSVQAQIINLFLELQQRLGLALVFITHDLRLVRHIAHRTAVMYLGRIVEIGPTEDLFQNPSHPYTKALISSIPQVADAMHGDNRTSRKVAVRGELPSPLAPPPGCSFHPRCPIAESRCRIEVPELASLKEGGMTVPMQDADWLVACHLAHETKS
jgi:oligopeptide/dipeptide ABC transporter ATP-binding protein